MGVMGRCGTLESQKLFSSCRIGTEDAHVQPDRVGQVSSTESTVANYKELIGCCQK